MEDKLTSGEADSNDKEKQREDGAAASILPLLFLFAVGRGVEGRHFFATGGGRFGVCRYLESIDDFLFSSCGFL